MKIGFAGGMLEGGLAPLLAAVAFSCGKHKGIFSFLFELVKIGTVQILEAVAAGILALRVGRIPVFLFVHILAVVVVYILEVLVVRVLIVLGLALFFVLF